VTTKEFRNWLVGMAGVSFIVYSACLFFKIDGTRFITNQQDIFLMAYLMGMKDYLDGCKTA